ncbi:MAG: hypothetical protein ACM3UZ_15000, partial [Acidobacteriota bacterium]
MIFTVDNLVTKLNAQADGFRAMLQISKGQLDEVCRGDFPNNLKMFNELLGSRRHLMEHMEELETEIKQIEASLAKEYSLDYFLLSSLKDKIDPGKFELVSQGFNNLGNILLEITKVDDAIEEEARKKLATARKPKKMTNNKAAARAYKESSMKGKNPQD